jgi:putative ABC transport system substrate-binding protein
MKRYFLLLFALVFSTGINATPPAENLQTLYISQIISHPALDATRKGILDELRAEGFIEGKNLIYKFATSQGDLTLSSQIASKFLSLKPKVIVAIGTGAAQPLVKQGANKKIPIVFSSITDPIGAGLIVNSAKNGGNVSGVSNFIELKSQLDLFKKIVPHLTKLGFIYNQGEVNSIKILKELKAIAADENISIIESGVNRTVEISSATNKLIGKVDAIFISNDNTALSAFKVIATIADYNKIPLFVSDTDLIKQGALASLGPNQYELGRQTGKMIAKIFNGKNIEDMKVEYPQKITLAINIKQANKIKVSIPAAVIAKATEIVE